MLVANRDLHKLWIVLNRLTIDNIKCTLINSFFATYRAHLY